MKNLNPDKLSLVSGGMGDCRCYRDYVNGSYKGETIQLEIPDENTCKEVCCSPRDKNTPNENLCFVYQTGRSRAAYYCNGAPIYEFSPTCTLL